VRRFRSIKTRGLSAAWRAGLSLLISYIVLRAHEHCVEHCLVIADYFRSSPGCMPSRDILIVLRGVSMSNLPRTRMLLKLSI
jgi:hypothetical protein